MAGVVKDRRRSTRVMVRGDAVLHLRRGRHTGRCLDLSTGGLLVLGPVRPRPGTRLEVELGVEGQHLHLRAELLRSREVKAGYLLAFRFVELEPSEREQLRALVNGKLLRSAQEGSAVVLDLKALRAAAANAASPAPEVDAAPAEGPVEPSASEEPRRHPPVYFQGDWFEDELVTNELPAIEPVRGDTVVAPIPDEPPPRDRTVVAPVSPNDVGERGHTVVTTALTDDEAPRAERTMVLAPEPVLATEDTELLLPTPSPSLRLENTEVTGMPSKERATVTPASQDAVVRGPTEGTVVLEPPPAADAEGTVVLHPVPAEPTLRFVLGAPSVDVEPAPSSSITADVAPPLPPASLRSARGHSAAPSPPTEPPRPPAWLRSDLEPSTTVTPTPSPPPPRPSQRALAGAIELLRHRGPVRRPGRRRPPRVIVSIPHAHVPARPEPWSPSS